jgi:PAS domain-containing protein
MVRLLEGTGDKAELLVHASVGFPQSYIAKYRAMPAKSEWSQQVLQKECDFLRLEDEKDPQVRVRMSESGVTNMITLALRGKDGPLGIIAVGSTRSEQFQADEISYLLNISNLLGLTLQNVRLFEQVATVQQQWAYTFDSIGDPILVHDRQGRILRCNLRLGHLLGRDSKGRGRRRQPRPVVARILSCFEFDFHEPRRKSARNRARAEGHHREETRRRKVSHPRVQRSGGCLHFNAAGALPRL